MDPILTIANLDLSLTDDQPGLKTLLNTIISNDLLYDTFFSFCTPASILRLSRTCQYAHAAVKDYMPRALKIDRIFCRFFTSSLAFRQLQARTGSLVSGSAALQFFDRSYYPESDLDIYVHINHRFAVAGFLFADGYKYVAEREQNVDFYKAASDDTLHLTGVYEFKGVISVFTFEKKRGDGEVVKAQMIVAMESPFEAILGFHSTCVMNVISCDTAYSLYPKATFEERTSWICGTNREPRTIAAHNKYHRRGWIVAPTFFDIEYRQDYHVGEERHVGDRYCWTIPLDKSQITTYIPLNDRSKPLTCDPVVACSWTLRKTASAGEVFFWKISNFMHLGWVYVTVRPELFRKFVQSTPSPRHDRCLVSEYINYDVDYILICLEYHRTNKIESIPSSKTADV